MRKKIFRSIITVALTVMVAVLLIASSFLYDYFSRLQKSQLKEELSSVAKNVNSQGAAYFDNYKSSNFRFTVIAEDGTVLYDSKVKVEEMENHKSREEVLEALKSGSGSASRYSATLTEETLYEAVRLQNGTVLRISVNQVTVGILIFRMLPAMCAIVIVSMFVALVLSDKMAKSIVKPLGELDLENPPKDEVYEELNPVLARLSMQKKQIKRQMLELKQKSDEFKLITASMNEGLVVLDRNGTVLSINDAAKKLFGVSSYAIGASFTAVHQSGDLKDAVDKAFSEGHSELREERNEREYQFIVSRTEQEGRVLGAIILCFDVTEAALAERQRREFTANVSHELKTPLQSIIGSAELLKNGLVKEEDIGRFLINIKNEAVRLVSVINDIIRLSQLDGESAPITEQVDLYDVANEVIKGLSSIAANKSVNINLYGNEIKINGIKRYVYEIIYNLCDNAIRYNREGGSVDISLKEENGMAVITVKDTGIGIPKEHQPRIFERFYRVDKSHSRQTGGTGLGLSIVKHAVAYHGGEIELLSEENKGTEVKVIFRLEKHIKTKDIY